jgi:hypothetical protein
MALDAPARPAPLRAHDHADSVRLVVGRRITTIVAPKTDRSGYMAYVIIVAFRAKPGAISAVATISTAKLRRR